LNGRSVIRPSRSGPLRRTFTTLSLVLPLAGFGGIERWLAPGKRLWPNWLAHDESATTRIDHTPWNDLLARYLVVGEVNLFRYRDVSPPDRQGLKAYLRKLASTVVGALGRAEQLAYWVNLYNSLTVDLVLDHYPVASIQDIAISPGLFSFGPWDKAIIQIEGEPVTLNDIEHRILRPIWQDARLHYVLNCASRGCPSLPPVALTAENAGTLMERGAISFVNGHGTKAQDGMLAVSSLYSWFIEDFGGDQTGVLAHLHRYAREPLLSQLAGRTRIDDDYYDWRLNDAYTG
jgi:hypothetical protein